MGQDSGRATMLESAIGIIYLFLLAIIVVTLLVIQSRFDLAEFGVLGVEHRSLLEKNEVSNSRLNIQRSEFDIQNFQVKTGLEVYRISAAGKAETYDSDTLYEKIDGKAPMYQEAGFVKLTTQRFTSSDNPDIAFEQYLYDMGNTRNAFSVYSRQKRTDVFDINDLDTRGFAYRTTNSIYITHGRFYIEMVGYAESDELINIMKYVAQKLVAQLPIDENDKITEIGYFPPGIIEGSVQFQITDAYGFDGLTNTWSAQYKVNNKAITIFFSRRSNADEAKKVANSYKDFLISNGAKIIDERISLFDFMGSTEIVFATGQFVGGVHGADDRESAIEAARVFLEHFEKINEQTGG